jgi:hypothetical protein
MRRPLLGLLDVVPNKTSRVVRIGRTQTLCSNRILGLTLPLLGLEMTRSSRTTSVSLCATDSSAISKWLNCSDSVRLFDLAIRFRMTSNRPYFLRAKSHRGDSGTKLLNLKLLKISDSKKNVFRLPKIKILCGNRQNDRNLNVRKKT